jgi:hypothetical protein
MRSRQCVERRCCPDYRVFLCALRVCSTNESEAYTEEYRQPHFVDNKLQLGTVKFGRDLAVCLRKFSDSLEIITLDDNLVH